MIEAMWLDVPTMCARQSHRSRLARSTMLRIAFVTMALVLTAAFSGAAKAAQPFPDCGLARYDDGLPAQVVRTLREMAGKLDELPPVEGDVTDTAYAEGVLDAVPNCLDPNVRFLANADGVAMELRGLSHSVCRNLIDSSDLRAAGATIQVRDVRTNGPIASCGHHPILDVLVGIGLNVVVVTVPRQRLHPLELIEQGRRLAMKNFETLFNPIAEPATLIEVIVAFRFPHQRLMKSSRRLTLKDGTKIGYLSPTEVPQAERDNKAAFKVIKALLVDDAQQPGWSTNCHGTTFLAGALWLNDANTIFDRALKKIQDDSVRPGDFVLWTNRDDLIVHSATIVEVGPSRDKILLYQDAGGFNEHIVSLKDHTDRNAPGSGDASDWFFARIRPGWPNSR
jgi:hypothetical protein